MKFKEAVTYDDMLIVPQYSDITSRSEVDISSHLGHREFSLPIIASPMDTVSGTQMALAMNSAGGLAVLHRYATVTDQQKMAQTVVNHTDWTGQVAAAIGVTGDYLERAEALLAVGTDILCVDVAHGHHSLMKKALTTLRKEYGNHIHIMAGNVCTLEGVNDLADWGADSIRCNIGGGFHLLYSYGYWTWLSQVSRPFLIAREPTETLPSSQTAESKSSGDIVKALAAGADFVMCGSLLAGTTESPGNIISLPDNSRVKEYRGMASKDAQVDWRNKSSTPEGVASYIPFKGRVHDILDDLGGGIRSGLSYSGARNLTQLRHKVEWARQTSAGTHESNTHIFSQKGKQK